MDVGQFREYMSKLGWEKGDFVRATGIGGSTIYQWVHRNQFPAWVEKHLQVLVLLSQLHHDAVVAPREVRIEKARKRKEPPRGKKERRNVKLSPHQILYKEMKQRFWEEYQEKLKTLERKTPLPTQTP